MYWRNFSTTAVDRTSVALASPVLCHYRPASPCISVLKCRSCLWNTRDSRELGTEAWVRAHSTRQRLLLLLHCCTGAQLVNRSSAPRACCSLSICLGPSYLNNPGGPHNTERVPAIPPGAPLSPGEEAEPEQPTHSIQLVHLLLLRCLHGGC